MQHRAYASLELELFIISLLNKNSCASNCWVISDPERIREEKRVAYLDETSIYEDPRAQRVQRSADD